MAVNLFALNCTEITTLVRPQIQPTSYRLDQEKIKANWDQIKNQSMDLVQISKEAGTIYENNVSLEQIQSMGELKRTECNYSSNAFFQKNMPQIMTDGSYLVGGVYFSKEELEQCRVVMKAAAENIDCGMGKGVDIDYNDYAQMGLAVSSVRTYAEEHLTKEQAEVVNKAMQEYNEALIDLEKQAYANRTCVETNYEGVSEYYGKAVVLDDALIDEINRLKEEISRLTGRQFAPTVKGMTAGVQSATNEKLIGEISDLFANTDIEDEESVNAAIETYKELMRPAYLAYGILDSRGALTRRLNEDAEKFRAQIANMLQATRYRATDYTI